MQVSLYEIYLYVAIAGFGGFWLGAWVQRMFVWYPFNQNPLTGKESMIGKKAVVSLVKPGYLEVIFDSRAWKAKTAPSARLEKGEMVLITDVVSNTLVVAPLRELNEKSVSAD